MNSRNDIQRELELHNSSLPFDVRMPVFDLPKGYFENFAADVLARIKGETAATAAEEIEALSPLLAGIPKQTPYSLPPDFFAKNLITGTLSEEDPVPGWAAEGRQNPYTVPAGYFSQFAQQVLQEVKPQARVISMGSLRWMQYAAAAVLAGALVLGGILYQQKPNATNPANNPEDWVAKKLEQVSNQELEAFILSTEVSGNEMAQQKGNTKEVRTFLKDVSSTELDAFLNQLPTETELIN